MTSEIPTEMEQVCEKVAPAWACGSSMPINFIYGREDLSAGFNWLDSIMSSSASQKDLVDVVDTYSQADSYSRKLLKNEIHKCLTGGDTVKIVREAGLPDVQWTKTLPTCEFDFPSQSNGYLLFSPRSGAL